MPVKNFFLSLVFLAFTQTSMAADVLIWTSNEGAANAINEIKKDFESEYKTKVVVEVLNKDLTSLFKTASLTKKRT